MLLNKNSISLLVAVLSFCYAKAADVQPIVFNATSSTTEFPTPTARNDLNPAFSTYSEKKKTTATLVPTTSTDVPSSSTPTDLPLPSTTTIKPSPTTTTTTSSTTTTTTTARTTTSGPITTPKPPTPVPDPGTGTWTYTESNHTCIITKLAIQLNITYHTIDDKPANVLYNVPINQTDVSSGNCGNGTEDQKITVQWGPRNYSSSFLLLFSLNTTTHEFSVKEIVFLINGNELPNSKNETVKLYHNGNVFSTPTEMSYHCTKVQTLNLTKTEDGKDVVGTVQLSHVQLEAYHKQNSAHFSYAKDCDAIDTPDIVPIAVGFALVALIVIVLIAYLVGRRRAQARGYVSM